MENNTDKENKKICEYGCSQEAFFKLKNGKWCCSENWQQCKAFRKKISEMNKGKNNPNYGLKRSYETKIKQSIALKGRSYIDLHGKEKALNLKEKLSKIKKGKKQSKESNRKRSKTLKGKSYIILYGKKKAEKIRLLRKKAKTGVNNHGYITIEKIKSKYLLFSKIEEMRYNPDKPGKKEIQVHCKNHNCNNSKEKSGWFTPSRIQLYERIRQLEHKDGTGGSYFYCSQKCKNECPLYYLRSDPLNQTNKNYTFSEYKIFREYVLERDDYKCEYCGEQAEHVHHERPQKLEPFFSLDPDLAWSVCKDCHYKYGHKDECSTGNLSLIICN